MIALTGIVFSLSFVMVQFSATAYSPRLVLWFSRDPLLAHAFGTFTATLRSMRLRRSEGSIVPIDERDLVKCVALGMERTFDQDPKYAIHLLVDIAIRALSPAR